MQLIQRAVLCVAVAFALQTQASTAAASGRCKDGFQFDRNLGDCVPLKKASRRSPEKAYQDAMAAVDDDAPRALRLFGDSCRGGNGRACTQLGYLHRQGIGTAASASDSMRFYKRACEHKDPDGCLGAADLIDRGLLRGAEQSTAIPHLKTGCELGSGRACYLLGSRYQRAHGVKEDAEQAKRLYTDAFKKLRGECPAQGQSCYYLGLALKEGNGTEKNATTAAETFRAGCDGGSGNACTEIAEAYYRGIGVGEDEARAGEYYDRACRRYENALACYRGGWMMTNWAPTTREDQRMIDYANRACELDKRYCGLLGYLHGTATGMREDQREATRYYQLACDNGSAEECYISGNRADRGNGIHASKARAVELWTQACDMAWGEACRQLGQSHAAGDGVAKDAKRGYDYLHLACIRDSGRGCYLAGGMVEKGEHGNAANPTNAVLYYQYSCQLKHGDACVRLSTMKLEGTAIPKEEKEGLQALVSGCTEANHADSCQMLGAYYYGGEHVAENKEIAGELFSLSCLYGNPQPCTWVDMSFAAGGKDAEARQRAFTNIDNACKTRNSDDACEVVGRLHAYGGTLVNKKPELAVALFRDRCERRSDRACVALATLYLEGNGVTRDYERAEVILREQCDKHTAGACFALGWRMWQAKNYEPAVQLFSRSCADGDPTSCNIEGFSYYTGKGSLWNVRKAGELYRKACELGNPLGCSNVGELLWHGIGGKLDLKESFEFFKKGCTPTESSGCTWVGRAYHLGKVTKRDLERAEKEYLRMCSDDENGSAEACVFLADLYEETGKQNRSRVAAIRQQAFAMASKLAERNPYGNWQLGNLYLRGVGTVENRKAALEQFIKGCQEFDPLACREAGRLQSSEESGLRDPGKAAFHLERACAAGLEDACKGAAPTGVSGETRSQKGCGCQGSESGSGLAAVLFAIAVVLFSRRRSPVRARKS